MTNASFVTAQAMPSAVFASIRTTNTHAAWHMTKPASYAAFYAGYEATWGSTR